MQIHTLAIKEIHMKARSFPILRHLLCCAIVIALPAWAGTVYDNGPINGTVGSQDISFGTQGQIGNSFTVSGSSAIVSGLTFGAWLHLGDTLNTVDVDITSLPNGGTIFFSQILSFSQSNCFTNPVGQSVCQETASFSGPTLPNGTYWLALSDALTQGANGVGWDQNNGVGCMSQGCPSLAVNASFQSIPSEAFTIQGGVNQSTPEPCSVMLLSSGVAAAIASFRRKRRGVCR
jgi:hypothetical protein